MSEESVIAEIHKLIDEKLASGVVVHVDWIAHGIMQKKGEIEGENAEFYRVCTHRQISQIAKRAIGKYQPKHQTDPQLVMEGFEHLSKAYPMTRGGDLVLVPITLCTDAELEARAADLVKMAKGSLAHAKEIRAYVSSRVRTAA
ncbi:hypothetical protein [Paradevosia shaoguanensis]|uniref:Uncharacterized protein n=1 Tax=Paradevosia shaoguanensis TaxID=1335043 RepID=A0AA41UDB6_9HYPH|nr:hypothetical protein [Paradevosia shaoguanensis]MCF1744752.1 hypothetical protein [Paradevosia shaoguanensis]MCI0129235.1 hypothetical protein [Paradevosia shaoguanensis]